MKKILLILMLACVFLTRCTPVIYTASVEPVRNERPQPVYAERAVNTSQVFYDELSPYGQWIDYPGYGYVWEPNVDRDFRPYETNGYWAYSDYGWTWVSGYSWGWATFHYGRWFNDDNYGWLWVPGSEWAPAWVTWGQSGSYYGWAPVPPHVSVNSGWRPRNEDWNYVRAEQITRPNVTNYVVHNNVTVINNTTIINNVNTTNITVNNNYRNSNTVLYNRGPRSNDVENITNIKVQPIKISERDRPGQAVSNNELTIYRPNIRQDPQPGSSKPAPQNVTGYGKGSQQPWRQRNDPNQGQQNPRPGYGQGNNQNQPAQQPAQPAQPNPRTGYGQGNNQSQPGQQPAQQNPRPGYGQGNNQNQPGQQPAQQNPRPGYGQGNNQSQPGQQPAQPAQQNPRPGYGQGNNQNQPGQQPAQPAQQNPRPGYGQGNNQSQPGQQPAQQNPRPGSGQGNNPQPSRPPINIIQRPPVQQPGPVPTVNPQKGADNKKRDTVKKAPVKTSPPKLVS